MPLLLMPANFIEMCWRRWSDERSQRPRHCVTSLKARLAKVLRWASSSLTSSSFSSRSTRGRRSIRERMLATCWKYGSTSWSISCFALSRSFSFSSFSFSSFTFSSLSFLGFSSTSASASSVGTGEGGWSSTTPSTCISTKGTGASAGCSLGSRASPSWVTGTGATLLASWGMWTNASYFTQFPTSGFSFSLLLERAATSASISAYHWLQPIAVAWRVALKATSMWESRRSVLLETGLVSRAP
mmetsp:Transcript_78496/g.243797  ORF Transcript_78496/g.243797 Transcript_78496/m.243797 type:complete len:243 (-) Transcript_78496:154-882(-)